MAKVWSKRFDNSLNPFIETFNASIGFDRKLILEDLDCSIAHAKMLGKTQVLSSSETLQIINGLEIIRVEYLEGKFSPNPPLFWKSSEKKIIKLDAEGFVLGLQKDAEYQCCEIKLNANDLILFYTDGVIDTSNSIGERFDEERLIKTFTKFCKQSYTSQEILNKIFKKLDDFIGQNRHLQDDASMVIFKLK